MDLEDIQEMIDEFIEQIQGEFTAFSKGMQAEIEEANEQIESFGLSREEDAYLVMNMVDPGAMLEAGCSRCKASVEHILDIISGMDPEDEKQAKKMVREAIRELHDDLEEFLFPSE